MTLPARLVIVVGTYDGVLGGWEKQLDGSLKLTLATAVHQGSMRSLAMAASPSDEIPGTLLSCGYDETMKTHDWVKRLNSSGEVRTPSDFGTPVCSSFAPPNTAPSTHCIIGFAGGKVALYKKRDWALQHVLAGHEGGVASLAVHPTGKLAISGGQSDGKLKLWDLTKGRLAYATKLTPSAMRGGKSHFEAVVSILWTKAGDAYAWSYGNHITVRDVDTGKDLLDVELPSRVNQITLVEGEAGIFVAAACNDGSLPLLAVSNVDEDESTRRAVLAIEPVDGVVAGEERFKCIQSIDHGYHVVTANSAGVVSVMNLQGAVNMMMSEEPAENDSDEDDEKDGGSQDEDSDDDEDMELAVDIVDSVQLGTGARVTCLTTWSSNVELEEEEEDIDDASDATESEEVPVEKEKPFRGMKREFDEVEMDSSEVQKARALVGKAKKLKAKKAKKNRKKSNSS